MANQVFRGQAVAIQIDMSEDVTLATGQKILYTKPNGNSGSWDATISGDKLIYNATTGELDIIGLWQLQGKVYLDGQRCLSGIVTLNVEKSLDD
jgi:hypothetical protein